MADRVATYDRIPSRDPAVLAAYHLRRSDLTTWITNHPGRLLYVRAYLDRGVSGSAQIHQRPARQRLVTDARKHTFRLLVVHSLNRLSRDTSVLLDLLAALEPTEIAIRSLASDPPEILTRDRLVRHLRFIADLHGPDHQ